MICSFLFCSEFICIGIIESNYLVDIGLVISLISPCVRFGSLCFLINCSISSKLLNLQSWSCLYYCYNPFMRLQFHGVGSDDPLSFLMLVICVFISVRGLSLVVASGGHSSSPCAGLSLSRPLLLRSTGSRRTGSVVVAHGPSCSAACGIFPDQGSNPCLLHQQADSQPLRHQGSPTLQF